MKLKYFSDFEFVCDDEYCINKMSPILLKKLDHARSLAEVPFNITSSWRSEEKNKAVGGASNSSHLRGNAVDIACNSSTKRHSIIKALLSVGFTRIGIANTFIHADVDEDLPQNVIWIY